MSGADLRPVGEDDLHGFIDGRLDPERRALVEAWLKEHPTLAAQVTTDRELRERLRARLAPIAEEAIPARLRVANLTARRPPTRQQWPLVATAALVCLVLGGFGGWFGHAMTTPSALLDAAARPTAEDAVAAFRTFTVEVVHPVEVRADEKPHLLQWLSKRLGRPFTAPDLRAQGFRLMGGRVLPTSSEPAALLMYDDDHGTRLTLYSRIGSAGRRTAFRSAQEGDIAAFSWIDGGMSYVVTARIDQTRLLAVAEAVDAQVRAFAQPQP